MPRIPQGIWHSAGLGLVALALAWAWAWAWALALALALALDGLVALYAACQGLGTHIKPRRCAFKSKII